MSDQPTVLRAMARYNRWMNEKMYAVAGTLSEADRHLDRGAFFKSIHGTLDHILLGDRLWLGRFNGRQYGVTKLGQPLFDDFAGLSAARIAIDQDMLEWADTVDAAWLAEDLVYRSIVDGKEHRKPRWLLTQHMFNHQTHHRGQVTTLLTQLGLDVGATDLPWMP